MPTPNNSARPAFTHPQVAVQNFVDMALDTPDMTNRSQFIMVAGILLNNTELISYSVSIDPAVINTPIPGHVQMIAEQIINPLGGGPNVESANATNPG